MSPSQQLEPKRILILRLGSMGDIIHSLPAVAALREYYPQAQLGWVVEERWSALLSTLAARKEPRGPGKPLVDSLHIVDTRAWRAAWLSDETWREIRMTLRELRSARYDLAIDIQGAIKSSLLGRLAHPERQFGFAQPWEKMATMFYTHPVQATGTHIAERNFSLVAAAGVPGDVSPTYPIPLDEAAEEWADQEVVRLGLSHFAILNPGAGWGSKCWPAARFGELASRLAKHGIVSLINFGPGEETLAQQVEETSSGAARKLVGSLSELIALLRRATLFVGGDTGPLHLAVALNTPSAALFGPTDPARNGPFGGRALVVRSPQSNTTYKRSPQLEPGLSSIGVEEVLAAASQLLGKPLA